jgi:hypothetical protein
MLCSNADIEVKIGGNLPIIFEFDDDEEHPVDLTGSSFYLNVAVGRGIGAGPLPPGIDLVIAKVSDIPGELVFDPVASTLTWTPTLAESRLIPYGPDGARYEMGRILGDLRDPLIGGALIGTFGLNTFGLPGVIHRLSRYDRRPSQRS